MAITERSTGHDVQFQFQQQTRTWEDYLEMRRKTKRDETITDAQTQTTGRKVCHQQPGKAFSKTINILLGVHLNGVQHPKSHFLLLKHCQTVL